MLMHYVSIVLIEARRGVMYLRPGATPSCEPPCKDLMPSETEETHLLCCSLCLLRVYSSIIEMKSL